MKKAILLSILFLSFAFIFNQCGQKSKDEKDEKETGTYEKKNPNWLNNAVIYEVNLRQFSAAGNFKGFEKRLDSLKLLGVDILWFMPLQPIGIKNRKGSLGSYYSIKDFRAINPEFGTVDDFRYLADLCHDKGFIGNREAICFRTAASVTTTNSQGWMLMALAAKRPQSIKSSTISRGTGLFRYARTHLRVLSASMASIVGSPGFLTPYHDRARRGAPSGSMLTKVNIPAPAVNES